MGSLFSPPLTYILVYYLFEIKSASVSQTGLKRLSQLPGFRDHRRDSSHLACNILSFFFFFLWCFKAGLELTEIDLPQP